MVLAFAALLAPAAMAAAPRGSIVPGTPMPSFAPPPARPDPTAAPPGYVTAPTPNQDAFGPTTRQSSETSVAPGLFTRRDQYRGEGLSPSSSTQADQDRRAKPGAGIKFNMPLQ